MCHRRVPDPPVRAVLKRMHDAMRAAQRASRVGTVGDGRSDYEAARPALPGLAHSSLQRHRASTAQSKAHPSAARRPQWFPKLVTALSWAVIAFVGRLSAGPVRNMGTSENRAGVRCVTSRRFSAGRWLAPVSQAPSCELQHAARGSRRHTAMGDACRAGCLSIATTWIGADLLLTSPIGGGLAQRGACGFATIVAWAPCSVGRRRLRACAPFALGFGDDGRIFPRRLSHVAETMNCWWADRGSEA